MSFVRRIQRSPDIHCYAKTLGVPKGVQNGSVAVPPRSFAWPLTPLAADLWTASVPIRFAGAWFPHVMTVIRLSDGSVVLHSPCKFSPALGEEIAAIGVVRHIVAPNWFHDLYLREYKAEYPQATLWGPRFLQRLKGDRLVTGDLDGPTPWEDAVPHYQVRGVLTFDESMFFHRQTSTLIVADLLMNVITADDVPFFTRMAFRLSGAQGHLCVFPLLRLAIPDFAALRRGARHMLDWDPQNIIVAHGSPVTNDARRQLREALSWLSPERL